MVPGLFNTEKSFDFYQNGINERNLNFLVDSIQGML